MFYQCSRSRLIKQEYGKSKIYVDRKCCKWCIIHISIFPNTILGPERIRCDEHPTECCFKENIYFENLREIYIRYIYIRYIYKIYIRARKNYNANNVQLIFLSENNFIFKKSKLFRLLQLHFSTWCCITVRWYRFQALPVLR